MKKYISSILAVFFILINFIVPVAVYAAEKYTLEITRIDYRPRTVDINIKAVKISSPDQFDAKDTDSLVVSIIIKNSKGEIVTSKSGSNQIKNIGTPIIISSEELTPGEKYTIDASAKVSIQGYLGVEVGKFTSPYPFEFTPGDDSVVVDTNTTNTNDEYKLLAPIGKFTKAPDNIGDYFNLLFKLAIGLCGVLAVVMIIISGVQYMGDESIFGKTEAKSGIKAAFLGLFIALGSYALLNTIDPRLLGGEGVKIDKVTIALDPEVHGDTPHTAINGKFCNGKYNSGDSWASDQKERSEVSAAGISVNAPNCTKVGQSGCTSLAGLNTSGVIAFKNKCGAACSSLTISGGTECWLHSNKTQHLPGNSIVDLRLSPSSFTNYVENNNPSVKASGMNFPVFIKNGTKLMKEPNHYHIISW